MPKPHASSWSSSNVSPIGKQVGKSFSLESSVDYSYELALFRWLIQVHGREMFGAQ